MHISPTTNSPHISKMSKPFRLGILGTNIQYLHILPTLPSHFTPIAIHPNPEPNQTTIPSASIATILSNPEIDLLINLLPNHEQHTIAALQSGKHVMVTVPLSMSIPSLRRIRDAIQKGKASRPNKSSPKVFISCPRRHAPAFQIFKDELAALDRIYYARCRNIAGPSTPDLTFESSALVDIFGEDVTGDRIAFCRYLATLGCHDLLIMREALGFPNAVSSVAITNPFYTAMFHYSDDKGHPFTLFYEAGVDGVPRSDAHVMVYGAEKTVSLQYDFPRAGDGTGGFVRVIVEKGGKGGQVERTETVSSCEEAHERELMALYEYLSGDETGEDAVMDLRLLLMIFEHYNRQCGTIKTPLG
ncbi:putative myoinositol-dehydrogenase spcB [Penicillium brevicompactum]